MILSSDLLEALQYTSCNTNDTVSQVFRGSNNAATPWPGVNNLAPIMNNISVNYQNVQPTLANYFSTNNAAFQNVVNTATNSLYYNSQQFTCPAQPATIIPCPFVTPNTNCMGSYVPEFAQNFCNNTAFGSASNLISTQMANNSTNWQSSIVNLSVGLAAGSGQTTAINNLTNAITTFVSSVSSYQSGIGDGLSATQLVATNTQIGAFVFIGLLMLLSILGFMAMFCSFCMKKFSWGKLLPCLWIFFTLFSIILFVLSGFFLTGSFATFDSCSAYNYYINSTTPDNFNKLNYSNTQIGSIINQCFFVKSQSIFTAFNTSSAALTAFQSILNYYNSALPSTVFTSYVYIINTGLQNYVADPALVRMLGENGTTSAQAAINFANNFANYSLPNSQQTCKVTQDYLAYNPISCYPYPINNNIGNSSCELIGSSNIASRITAFNTASGPSGANCATQGTTYQNNFNQLNTYGSQVITYINAYLSSPNLNNYLNSYFAYYNVVVNFMNAAIQSQFMSFIMPYMQLYQGSSCAFVTGSLGNISYTACNSVFTYLNALSIVTIVLSVCVFILMVLSYFMSTRMQFYEHLDGDFDNYAKPEREDVVGIELDSKNNSFLVSADRSN